MQCHVMSCNGMCNNQLINMSIPLDHTVGCHISAMTRETLRQAHWRCAMHVLAHWRCPKSWVYPQIIQFVWGCSTINHPASGILANDFGNPRFMCIWINIEPEKSEKEHPRLGCVYSKKSSLFGVQCWFSPGGVKMLTWNCNPMDQVHLLWWSVMARGLFPCQQLGALRLGSAPWTVEVGEASF